MKRKMLTGLLLLGVVALGLMYRNDANAASALTSRLIVRAYGSLTSTSDLMTGSVDAKLDSTLDLANGTGAGQADVVWSDTRTIAASTAEDIDVIGGGLLNPYGVAFAPAKLKMIVICASAANTNNVIVGGDANSVPFLDTPATTLSIQPGGCFVLTAPKAAGIACTAGTGDIIQTENSGAGTTVTFNILLVGTSA